MYVYYIYFAGLDKNGNQPLSDPADLQGQTVTSLPEPSSPTSIGTSHLNLLMLFLVTSPCLTLQIYKIKTVNFCFWTTTTTTITSVSASYLNLLFVFDSSHSVWHSRSTQCKLRCLLFLLNNYDLSWVYVIVYLKSLRLYLFMSYLDLSSNFWWENMFN